MRWTLVWSILLGVVLLSGCMNQGFIENERKVSRLGDEQVKKIVVWHTYSDEETRIFEEEIIPEFELQHPNIRIEAVRQGYNQQYQAALLSRLSAGKTPDIVRMDYTMVPRFASNSLLRPLDEFDNSQEVADQLRENMLETNHYRNHIYGLPLNISTKAAIYNKMLLEKVGLKEPPKSLSEVVEIARRNKLMIGMSGPELWNSLPYFFGFGGELADEHFTRTNGYLNSGKSIHAVQIMLDLYRDRVINPHMLDGSADLWKDIYSSWNLLMLDEGPWFYSILMNSANLNADLMKLTLPSPFPSDGKYKSVIGGESLVMTKGVKYPEEAWEFICWMMREDTQTKLSDAGLIPSNMKAFRHLQEASMENSYIKAYLEGIEDAFYRPPIPQWDQIEQIYTKAIESIFVNGTNIKETLDGASVQIDALLYNR